MLKKIVYTLVFVFSCGVLMAQESVDSVALESDSLLMLEISDSTLCLQLDSQVILPLPLDTILHDYFVEKSFQIDCERADSGAIYYSDSVYMARLQSMPHIMEMTYNRVVKACIERYARCPKDVGYMLGIGNAYYFPMFEEALERHNVPLELKYLPVIESALNAKAKSPVGASGLWQFMVGTGKIYGLEVNSMVDERRDPRKASDAAARFLADLYKLYGDWHLVIAAYNCGPGNVAKALRIANGKRNFWEIYSQNDYQPIECINQGVVQDIIDNNLAVQLSQLKQLKNYELQLQKVIHNLENNMNFETSISNKEKIKEMKQNIERMKLNIRLKYKLLRDIEHISGAIK